MTTELAISLLLATNVALGMAAFHCLWKWGVWKERAKGWKQQAEIEAQCGKRWFNETQVAKSQQLQAEAERDALLAAQTERRANLSKWGKIGRKIQLEKRRAA